MLYALEGTVKKSVLLTALMLSTTPTTAQQTALDTWADHWLPSLTEQARALFSRKFDMAEVGQFARQAVTAAQDLKGVFGGSDRAGIAQAILHTAISTYAPANVKVWILPLVDGPGCCAIIEAAFRVVFGPIAQASAPVVDASDVAEGGIQ